MSATDDARSPIAWGGRADDDEPEQVEDDELAYAPSLLDEVQQQRVEALGAARGLLRAPAGLFGGSTRVEAPQLVYLAEWILKGDEEAAEDHLGTDAEQDAPTDGGGTGVGEVDLR